MMLNRRPLLLAPALLAAPALAQTNQRPAITVAVQKISNTNTLEVLREQSNVGERVFYSSMWEPLIGRNWAAGLEPVPGLATAWRRVDDRTVELDLRQGVRFHDGTEMTSEDVVFSFGPERMFGTGEASGAALFQRSPGAAMTGREPPPEVPAVARRIWPALERVEATGRYQVRFINRTPDVTMEGKLSRMGSDICSKAGFMAAGSWLDWARKPITSGPYMVAEFRPDVSLTLVAHDAYWGGRPPLRQVRFVEVPEVSSRINGLLSGEYQFACDITPDQIAAVERNRAFEVQGGTVSNHRITCFDKNHPVLADARVRRAMTHSMDRQAIVASLWGGRTVVPKGLQWPFYGDMFLSDWEVPRYDVAEARRLLREANYRGQPIPYRLLNNYYTNQVGTAQILVEMWRQAGLNVVIEMKENFSQVFDRSSGQRGVRDWSNSAPFSDPVSSLVNQHGPRGQQQQIGEWTNEEFNRLSGELEASTDQARRRIVFRRMLEIAEREDPAYTLLHQNATFTAKRADIRWKAAPAFAMDFRVQNWGA